MILQIEKISMNAWPALETIQYDGWIVRFANGFTKRSNSVNPIYDSILDIDSKIEYCEKLYRSRNLPVCFKITDIAKPAGIDKTLEAKGYNHEFDISVQFININKFSKVMDRNVNIVEFTDDSWIENYIKMNETNSLNIPILKQIIDLILLPKCLLTLTKGGIPVGCGLGVVSDKHIGLFDIVIDKQYRNQGLGKILIENLLIWGRSIGAEFGYLQVLADNAPANRLYNKIGFKEVYKYWYRIKDDYFNYNNGF